MTDCIDNNFNFDLNLNLYVLKENDLVSCLDDLFIYLKIWVNYRRQFNNLPYRYFGIKEDLLDIRDIDLYVIKRKRVRNSLIILNAYIYTCKMRENSFY